MFWSDERAAFESRLSQNFSSYPVQYPGVSYDNQPKTPWVKMQLLPGISKRITLGSNAVYRELGTLVLMVFTPVGQGSNVAKLIADELSPIFNEAVFSFNQSGTIHCRVPELDERGPTQDGLWYQVNVRVDYYRDITLA